VIARLAAPPFHANDGGAPLCCAGPATIDLPETHTNQYIGEDGIKTRCVSIKKVVSEVIGLELK